MWRAPMMADAVYDSLEKYFDRGPMANGLPAEVDEYLLKHTAGNPAVAAAEKQFEKVSSANSTASQAQYDAAYRAAETAELKALGFPSADAAVKFVDGRGGRTRKGK